MREEAAVIISAAFFRSCASFLFIRIREIVMVFRPMLRRDGQFLLLFQGLDMLRGVIIEALPCPFHLGLEVPTC